MLKLSKIIRVCEFLECIILCLTLMLLLLTGYAALFLKVLSTREFASFMTIILIWTYIGKTCVYHLDEAYERLKDQEQNE